MLIDILAQSFNYTGMVKYTSCLIPSILVLIYSLSAKNEDYFYMFSFLFTFLGLYSFNYAASIFDESGIFFYAAGLAVYLIITLRDFDVKYLNKNFKKFLPLFIIVFFITCFILVKVTGVAVYAVSIYSCVITLFFLVTLSKYLTIKSKNNLFLFISGLLLLITSILSAYTFFWERLLPVKILADITYCFGHYYMCKYMLELQKQDTTTPFLNALLNR